jgi:hypothetical protein
MRIGQNPTKNKSVEHSAYHKIIVPIYVPSLEGYFKDGLKITKLCIESLITTKHDKALLAVVNNHSCKEVRDYLQSEFESGRIDQLIHHNKNFGKIDAVVPIARSSQEPLITITDGDVLFKQGWMQAVEEVYDVFPEAGMVSPVPLSTHYMIYTNSTILGALLKGNLKIRKNVIELAPMQKFAESIDRGDIFFKKYLRKTHALTVKRNNTIAIVGCGHFVATYNKDVFNQSPEKYTGLLYASKADKEYLDIPVDKGGFWRLATQKNFAFHMGNHWEDWMTLNDENLIFETNHRYKLKRKSNLKINSLLFFVRRLIVSRVLLSKRIKPYFFSILGLSTSDNSF